MIWVNKDAVDQVNVIKKKVRDVFMELKQTIDQKEQEMLSEADAFIQKSTKQIDHLSRLANGRAMNLGEQIQAIDQVLSNYDPVAA